MAVCFESVKIIHYFVYQTKQLTTSLWVERINCPATCFGHSVCDKQSRQQKSVDWTASEGASQVAWHVAPCWGVDTGAGGGEHHPNHLCTAEALSKKRKPREHKQRRSPTALSPHCQETGLGLGRGGRGAVEEWKQQEEEEREKETKTQQVCSSSM